MAVLDAPQQKSIAEFVESIVRELKLAEGKTAKGLIRELMADSLRKALDLGEEATKTGFLEALSANIHKFPLQEQQSLARVFPVEISSEYLNLQSFVEASQLEDPEPLDRAPIPQRPVRSTRTTTPWNWKIPDKVDTMSQALAQCLTEDRITSPAISHDLLVRLQQLFQGILNPTFWALYKGLGPGDANTRLKEDFLLKTALCIRLVTDRRLTEHLPELQDLAAGVRRQCFYVEGFPDLMEDWLHTRMEQLNDQFVKKANALLGQKLHEVFAHLRQRFRPGKWIKLNDPNLEDDLFAVFLDETFPRNVLSHTAVAKLLRGVTKYGGGDFHIYADIARLPPQVPELQQGALLQDPVEMELLNLLRRFPPFPPLRRMRPRVFQFGSMEVEFAQQGIELVALTTLPAMAGAAPISQRVAAADFFLTNGPKEFPNAAAQAVEACQSGHPLQATGIQAEAGALYALPMRAIGLPGVPMMAPQIMAAPSQMSPFLGAPRQAMPMYAAPMALQVQSAPPTPGPVAFAAAPIRYQPYPAVQTQAAKPKLGLEDDEI